MRAGEHGGDLPDVEDVDADDAWVGHELASDRVGVDAAGGGFEQDEHGVAEHRRSAR